MARTVKKATTAKAPAKKRTAKKTTVTAAAPVENTTVLAQEPAMPKKRLFRYRLSVRVDTPGVEPVQSYYVDAPTQCAATKFTAIQPEVSNILFVQQFMGELPEGAKLLSTEEDCT